MRTGRFIRCTAAAITLVMIAVPAAYAQTEEATPTAESPAPAPVDVPLAGVSPQLSVISEDLDEATRRAFELETEIEAVDADNRALEERIAVTAQRLAEQETLVQQAEARLAEAKERYRKRLVEVYKWGSFDPLNLLLSSDSLSELVSRAGVLSRIAESDSRVVSDLNVAAADARYQRGALSELQQQDKVLKQAQEERRATLTARLAEQEALVARLTVEAREALVQARRFTAETRQQWRLSSIPANVEIPRAEATVDTHPGVSYLVSAYMPRAYRSSGQTFRAVCSWYGPGFDGRTAASGQVFNERDLTCASRTLPFGTVLALTRGDRRVIVYVNDRGPYIAGRDLDLSRAAASALGFGGVAAVDAEIIAPAD